MDFSLVNYTSSSHADDKSPKKLLYKYHLRYAHLPAKNVMPRDNITKAPMINPAATCLMCIFLGCSAAFIGLEEEHGGSMPPQRPALPARSSGLKVINNPLDGTGPSSLLSDRFSISRAGEVPKFTGIEPTKELLDKSSMANVGIVASAFGISPVNRLFLRFRLTSFSQEAILSGISPDKWLLERSSTDNNGQS
ncbi:hypothetical protein GQ457_06G018320 [Hibiscus cannabinus]